MLTANQEGVKLRIRRRHSLESKWDGGAGAGGEDVVEVDMM